MSLSSSLLSVKDVIDDIDFLRSREEVIFHMRGGELGMMKSSVRLSECRVGNMSVDLGRRDRGMSEELLDDTDISTILQERRRKRVSEGMSRYIFRDARSDPTIFDHRRDKKSRETYIIACVLEVILWVEIVPYKEGCKVIRARIKICLDRLTCFTRQKNRAYLGSLAADSKL